MWRTHRTVRFCTAVSFRDSSPSLGRSSWNNMKAKAWWSCVFSLSSNIFKGQLVFLSDRKTSDEDHVRDEGVCLDRECWESVQFCCSMRFSSSSADRSRKAADSRYPAISWRTAATSVWLSWAEAPPPPPFLARLLELDEDEFEARDFILRSVGPEWRGQKYNYRHKTN